MFPIVDVSEWEADTTVIATGRRAKEWLIEPRLRRHGLFKLPRYHFAESTVEKLASEIGRLFGIPTAEVDLAVRDGRYGSISYDFLEPNENLLEGGELLTGRDATFDRFGARVHSFEIVEEVLTAAAPGILDSLIELLVFDAAIGNSDRHHDNWGVIFGPVRGPRLAPAYDHGSSLGSHLDENELEAHLAVEGLERHIRRGRSRIVWRHGEGPRGLHHLDLLRTIDNAHRPSMAIPLAKVRDADLSGLSAILERVPAIFASESRLHLVDRLVRRRIALLKEAFP
jgi:hypothetical protein